MVGRVAADAVAAALAPVVLLLKIIFKLWKIIQVRKFSVVQLTFSHVGLRIICTTIRKWSTLGNLIIQFMVFAFPQDYYHSTFRETPNMDTQLHNSFRNS